MSLQQLIVDQNSWGGFFIWLLIYEHDRRLHTILLRNRVSKFLSIPALLCQLCHRFATDPHRTHFAHLVKWQWVAMICKYSKLRLNIAGESFFDLSLVKVLIYRGPLLLVCKLLCHLVRKTRLSSTQLALLQDLMLSYLAFITGL